MIFQLYVKRANKLPFFLSLYPSLGVLTQGGGVFSTFVSSFYLQFSQDGGQWYTYKELVTDARPRAKVRPHLWTTQFDIAVESRKMRKRCSPSRFFKVTATTKGWQRVDWTGWCRLGLSACCRMTSRTASTFDLRSWAAGMVGVMLLC